MCEIERLMKDELGDLDEQDKRVLENMREFEKTFHKITLLL